MSQALDRSSSQMLDERKQQKQEGAQPYHRPVELLNAPSWGMDRHYSSFVSSDAAEQLRNEREVVQGMGRSLAPVNQRKKRTMTPTEDTDTTPFGGGDSTQREAKRARWSPSDSMRDEKA